MNKIVNYSSNKAFYLISHVYKSLILSCLHSHEIKWPKITNKFYFTEEKTGMKIDKNCQSQSYPYCLIN